MHEAFRREAPNTTKERPVNLRRGRRTVVTLPSGEEVAFEPDRDGGHLRLIVSVPPGARMQHLPSGFVAGERND